MHNVVVQYSRFLVLLVGLAFAQWATAVPEGPVIGKVTLLLGTVTAVDQDGDPYELTRGGDLYSGLTIETAARSVFRAEMNDGTKLTLSQNGSATLDGYAFDEATSNGNFNLTVRRGGFRYSSGLLGNASARRVHSRIVTPSGVIGVRGTVIEAIYDPVRGLVISVPEGTVEISYVAPDGTTQTYAVGEDGDTTLAEVSPDGLVTLPEDMPQALQDSINTLIEAVEEAEAADTADDGTAATLDTESLEITVEPNPEQEGSQFL